MISSGGLGREGKLQLGGGEVQSEHPGNKTITNPKAIVEKSRKKH